MAGSAQAASCGAIVDNWTWFTGGTVVVNADGTMVYGEAANDGTWECNDSTQLRYTLKWRLGGYVNHLALSADGVTLASTDPSQAYVRATRIIPPPRQAPPQAANEGNGAESRQTSQADEENPGHSRVAPDAPKQAFTEPPFPQFHGPWDRDAVYRAREAQLKQLVADHPDSPDALVALASFYLKPLAPRDVKAFDGQVRRVMVPLRNEIRRPVKDIYAVSWVFRGDTHAAYPLLVKTLQLNPHHARAVREMALLYRMKHDLDRMEPYVQEALQNDPMDLDMCRLHMDYRTALAAVQSQQASLARMPKIISSSHNEERRDGTYKVTKTTKTPPSAADLARADALDAQAKGSRQDAIRPLQNLMHVLSHDPNIENEPANKSKWRLASAMYYDWTGDLDKAGGAALGALRADPTSLDALDYIVDLLRLGHAASREPQYKALLDLWSGADSSPALVDDSQRKGARR